MNCVEPAGRAESNKSPPSTKEMRNGRAFLEIPPANPCAPLEARRQQPSEEAHRGGQKGAFGGKGGSGSRGAFQVTYRFSSLKPSTPFPEFIFDLESGYLVLES